MADTTPRNDEGGEPAPPESLLPEESVLTLEEYLDMQRAIGNPTRFRILRTLQENGALGATELRDALDLPGNTLHYHLDRLVDVGLLQNRKRKEPDADGLYSYYRATAMGEAILEYGVTELLRREHEFLAEYGSRA